MDPQNITLISNRGNSPVLTQGGAHMPCRLIAKPKHTVRGNTMQHIRLFFFFFFYKSVACSTSLTTFLVNLSDLARHRIFTCV